MPSASLDRQQTIYIGIAALAYYLLILGGHQYSIDGMAMFQSAKALVFQHSWQMEPPVVWGRAAIRVSVWPLGMTLAYVPLLLAWWPLFARFPDLRAIPYDPSLRFNPALYSNLPYLLCSIINPVVTAATACLVFRAGRLLGFRRAIATLAALAYGFASPAVAYARFDFAQPLAALALTGAVYGLLRAGHRRLGGEPGTEGVALPAPPHEPRPVARESLWALAWPGAAMGYAVLTRIEFVLFVPWMAAWGYWRRRRVGVPIWRALAVLVGGVAVALAVYGWVNWLKFGHPAQLRRVSIAPMVAGSAGDVLQGVVGLLISPTHGLLVFFPPAWVATPGLAALRRSGTGAASLFGGVMAISLALYASFDFWSGGWSWGPRYLLPLVPMLALAAAAWVDSAPPARDRPRRTAFAVLFALGVVAAWSGVVTDFVSHMAWVARRLGRPEESTRFHLLASPLVTGWWPEPGRLVDVLWVRLAAGRFYPSRWARVVGVVAPLALACAMAWAGSRVIRTLRGRDE